MKKEPISASFYIWDKAICRTTHSDEMDAIMAPAVWLPKVTQSSEDFDTGENQSRGGDNNRQWIHLCPNSFGSYD